MIAGPMSLSIDQPWCHSGSLYLAVGFILRHFHDGEGEYRFLILNCVHFEDAFLYVAESQLYEP